MGRVRKKIPMYRDEKKLYDLESILNKIDDNHGIIRTKEIERLGVDYRRLQQFVEEGELMKIRNSVYTNPHKYSEEELIIALFPDGILTMETALYYYGYLDERPASWKIAVDKNTSKSRFNMYYPSVDPYLTEPKTLAIGRDVIEINGMIAGIYNRDRLMADVLKHRKRIYSKDFQKAIMGYINDPKKNIPQLMRYAEERKVVQRARYLIGEWV